MTEGEDPISLDGLLEWLHEECRITITASGIRKWCKKRGFPRHHAGRGNPYFYKSEVRAWYAVQRSTSIHGNSALADSIRKRLAL